MPSLRDSGKIIGSTSIRQLAQQCNWQFPLSLRQIVDAPGCPFSQGIQLHLKVLVEPNISIETMLNRMREVYSTVGIRVIVASRENLTGPSFATLLDLDVGQCQGSTTAEQNLLFQNRNFADNNGIVIYFVRTASSFNGCASHPGGRPGAVVVQTASQWTLAHEVGHVLGLNHISGEHEGCPASKRDCCSKPDFTRLMTDCSTSNITGTPTFDQSERITMLDSSLTNRV